MSVRQSISQWIAAWRGGDQRAAHELWRRYYQRAAGLVRRRMRGLPHGDEEDVAAQALHSLLQRTAQGNFERMCSREDFWRLLITITRRKAIDQYRWSTRQKRGGASTSVIHRRPPTKPPEAWEDTAESPEDRASFNEMLERLLADVDDELRTIIHGKMAGYTNVEIAAHVNRSLPTIERRLRRLRELLSEESLACPAD